MQRGRSIQFAMEKFLRDGKNFQGMKQLQLETQNIFNLTLLMFLNGLLKDIQRPLTN